MSIWKKIGYVFGAIIALILIVVSVVYGMSEMRFRKEYRVKPETHAFSSDSAVVARGAHLVNTIGCADCHGEGLVGNAVIDAPPMGRVVAPNLTRGRGGLGDSLTPTSIEQAVRHGVARSGRALLLMPAEDFQYLSDDDMRAIASYVHTLPPTDHVQGANNIMLLPRALLVAGQMPILAAEKLVDSAATPMIAVPGPTVEYGTYLSLVAGCQGCHGPGLSGGKVPGGDPGWPPAANLTPSGALGNWTEAQFVNALRTGKRPDGSEIKTAMPWKQIGRMSDDELHAIWLYLHTVRPKPFGQR
jgi:cytochrome c553